MLLNLFPPPYGLQSQGPWKSGGHSLSLEACASGSRRGGRPGGHARRAAREAGRAAWARSAGEGTTGRAAYGAGGVRGGRATGRGRRGQGRSRMRWHGGSQRRRPTAWAAYRAGGLPGGRPTGRAANGAGGLPGGRPSAPAGEPHRRAAGGRGKMRGTWQAGKALGADVLSPDTTVLASTLEDGVEDVPLSAPVNGPRWKTSPGIRRFKSLFSTLSQVGTSAKNTSRVCENRTSSNTSSMLADASATQTLRVWPKAEV